MFFLISQQMAAPIVCRNIESSVIPVPASKAWSMVRQLNFATLMPSMVKSCSMMVPETALGPHSTACVENQSVVFEDMGYRTVALDDKAMSPFLCGAAVGSLRRVVYKDSAEFVFRVVEISDIQRIISYELIETDATVNVSSVLHTIQIYDVTETGETFIIWTTEFSGDCDQHVFSDAKFKKLDAFKDFRNVLIK
jgi:hypothetical protein